MKKNVVHLLLIYCAFSLQAQIPDPDLGLRADWMRGTWGINWGPAKTENGKSENLFIDPFLEQIKNLRTIDYIQVRLGEPFTGSPVHLGPSELLESLWQGDTDSNGDPINLVVPRAASGRDPFLDILLAVRKAGLKTMVYVNSSNMLLRWDGDERIPAPQAYPDITERWKNWCNTTAEAQAFINSQTYHTNPDWPERQYMFCYAEFVLKDYAIRYGKLIDAWLFDSGRMMWQYNGDKASSDNVDDQRIFQAFADACHAENPDAAIAFNNAPGSNDLVNNPFSDATLFDDYMFGHPFSGGKNLGDHVQNLFALQWIAARNGYIHTKDWNPRTWDDKVVGHFDPPMSTTLWNSGGVPALTNEEFVQWYGPAILGGGAISLGGALIDPYNWGKLTLLPYAIEQVILLDNYLVKNQSQGSPNWARQETILPEAFIGQAYYHAFSEGRDFWNSKGDATTIRLAITGANLPSWLRLSESGSQPGTWILEGFPTEELPADYAFSISAENAAGEAIRALELKVLSNPINFTDSGDGTPVWYADTLVAAEAQVFETYTYILVQGRDFYDFEGDALTITYGGGADWLEVKEVAQGRWQVSGVPPQSAAGEHFVSLSLSDGTHTKEVIIPLSIDQYYMYKIANIQATENTNYGVDSHAFMISDTITAPDGLATFQISMEIVPQAGKAILSGFSGGVSTAKAWGLGGDGREATKDYLFFGDSADWVDIGNIQIRNFEANGGELSLSDFRAISFKSITLVNAQSGNKDAVAFAINGDTTDIGNIAETPLTIDIENVTETSNISGFSIGIGDSPDQLRNKWSVEEIGVMYDMGVFRDLILISEHGSVLKTPQQTAYKHATQVKLVADPDSIYQFESWYGDISDAKVNGDTLTIIMDANKNITANFSILTHTIKIIAEHGTVDLVPDSDVFDYGTEVMLAANPDPLYQFEGWGGDTIGATIQSDTLIIVMNADKSINANFSLLSGIIPTESMVSFTVSPNPSTGIFKINMDRTTACYYYIYSINGANIMEGKATGQFEIDLSALNKGLYFLKITTEHSVNAKKIILNKY